MKNKDYIIKPLNKDEYEEFSQMFGDYFWFDCEIKHDRILIKENVVNKQILPSYEKGIIFIDMLKDENKNIGFIMYQVDSDESDWNERLGFGFIREFFVLKEYRRLGLGSLLLKNAENKLKKLGVQHFYLTSSKKDYVKDFYRVNGYEGENVFTKNGNEYFSKTI